MVVCQFFLKGTCKFGNKCRNEHTNNNNSSSTFNPRQSTFGGGGGGQQNDRYHYTRGGFGNAAASNNSSSSVDSSTILQAVRKELQEWDNNKVWPFSCFAAQREQKCLTGLDDHSPEE